MPRQSIAIVKANGNSIIMEGVIGKDFRLSIPKAVRNLVSENARVRITIEKI